MLKRPQAIGSPTQGWLNGYQRLRRQQQRGHIHRATPKLVLQLRLIGCYFVQTRKQQQTGEARIGPLL